MNVLLLSHVRGIGNVRITHNALADGCLASLLTSEAEADSSGAAGAGLPLSPHPPSDRPPLSHCQPPFSYAWTMNKASATGLWEDGACGFHMIDLRGNCPLILLLSPQPLLGRGKNLSLGFQNPCLELGTAACLDHHSLWSLVGERTRVCSSCCPLAH